MNNIDLTEDLKVALEILQKSRVFAVVGATPNKEKYGYKVLEALREANYHVFPLNPKYESIEGLACYPSLGALPEKPDVVVTVVPPEVTLNIADECHNLDIKAIWMQPGSESEEAVARGKSFGLKIIHNLCLIYVLKTFRPSAMEPILI